MVYRIYEFIRRNIILVASIFVLSIITGIFLIVTTNNNKPEQEMKRDAVENEKIEQIKEQQQEDRLGGEEFTDGVKELPTKEELKDYLESQTSRIGTNYNNDSIGGEEIEKEYGNFIRTLYSNGIMVSDSLTTDQKIVVMNRQENLLFRRVNGSEMPLVMIDGLDYKGIYEVLNYLGHKPRIISNQIIFLDNGEKVDVTGEDERLIYGYDLSKESLGVDDLRYKVTTNLDKDLIDGVDVSAVVVANAEITDGSYLAVHLIVVPDKSYTYDEFKKIFDTVEIKVDGETLGKDNIEWVEYLGRNVNSYQMIRVKYQAMGKVTDLNVEVNGKQVKLGEVTEESAYPLK